MILTVTSRTLVIVVWLWKGRGGTRLLRDRSEEEGRRMEVSGFGV